MPSPYILFRKLQTATRLLLRFGQQRFLPLAPSLPGERPRVLFVVGSEGAPMRYRVLNQAEQLAYRGIAYGCISDRYLRLEALVGRCDLLLLCRADNIPQVQRAITAARAQGKPVVYDTDDLIWDQNLVEYCALEQQHPAGEIARFRKQWRQTEALMREADAFIASTPYLAGLLTAHFGKPAYANQNALAEQAIALSTPYYEKRMAHPPSEHITLAYFSGWPKAHEIDLAVALPALQRVLEALPQARLRIIGHFDLNRLPKALQSRVETAPFVPYEQLFASIAAVDINLAPIVNNPHRRSKSAVKFLEAALVGVPTVASNLEPYHDIIHGKSGFLADDDESWYTALMALATNAALRRRIGQAAREQVLANDTTIVRAPAFVELLKGLSAK